MVRGLILSIPPAATRLATAPSTACRDPLRPALLKHEIPATDPICLREHSRDMDPAASGILSPEGANDEARGRAPQIPTKTRVALITVPRELRAAPCLPQICQGRMSEKPATMHSCGARPPLNSACREEASVRRSSHLASSNVAPHPLLKGLLQNGIAEWPPPRVSFRPICTRSHTPFGPQTLLLTSFRPPFPSRCEFARRTRQTSAIFHSECEYEVKKKTETRKWSRIDPDPFI